MNTLSHSHNTHISRLSGIKAVLFDLFDTLLLVRATDFGESCLKNLYRFLNFNGIKVSYEDFMRVYSAVRKKIYEEADKSLEEPHFNVRISETLKRLGYNHDVEDPIVKGATDAYSEEFMHYIYPDGEAYHVLRRLRERGYKIGVISNFAIPECAHRLIGNYELRALLDAIVISAEINRRKPSPEIYNFMLNLLEVKSWEAIFVGDTPDVDIRGAKKVGMKTILILRRDADINVEDKPDFTIRRLSEILNLLDNQNTISQTSQKLSETRTYHHQ